ncbi:hypothetical protein J2N86_01065 [Legionella lytica]|uniref:Type IV toxin-antitoxin system AbiEi family antitoxin domain-containing protein n=1 Tax=Legionella lytica TaxID=96232 RepID=A0ABY4Y952_9GAMM|nr:DUF6088 family protein [Legionella lytica]USQ13971.1 hypothetical protein J2N86_01065 [Legionella lytica]
MSTTVLIEKFIKKIPKGRIFFVDSIYKKYPIKLVQRVLLRLAKSNDVGTISRGIYFRPEKNRLLPGRPIPPSTDKIIEAVSKKTGEIITVHPAVALNQLGLSTQIPVHEIYYTTGRSRYIKINGENRIKLVHVSPRKIVMPNTVTCHVVNALWYEGKGYLKPRVVKKLHDRLKDKYFSEVLMHLDKMPVWMRKVFIRYQSMQPDAPELREDRDEYWQG